MKSTSEAIPQAKGLPLIGSLPDIDPKAPVQSIVRMAERNGPFFRIELPGNAFVIVGSQALTDELCDETRFEKALHRPLEEARTVAGDGLFTARNEEPNWGKAHRLLMPAFGPMGLRSMFGRMLDIAEQMMTRWERFGEAQAIDVSDNMTRLTLDTIALSAFDFRFNSFYQSELHPFVTAMSSALEEAGRRARLPHNMGRLNFLRARMFDADTRVLREVADRLIEERMHDPRLGERGDLLDRMLTARDLETGETLSRENIGYQMITFLVAGHETTSGLLSFATWLLLTHPDVLAKARAEVDAVLEGEVPSIDDMGCLSYIEQVLQETLRLWPTAPAFGVKARRETTIGGRYRVTPDDTLLILTSVLHRDPTVWDEPDAFRPERFSPEAVAKLPPNAWKPFGNGRRACIGRGFAMQEAVLVLAMMLQRFDIALADSDYQLLVGETLTLKPKGLKIYARRRDPKGRKPLDQERAAMADPVPAPEPAKAKADLGPIAVLYGSNSGTSEAFARRIAGEASARGYEVSIAPMDDYAENLPAHGPLIVVTASYEGHPPANAGQFLAAIEALPEDALASRRFAVFGCGDRQWARTYQAIPKRVEAALTKAGGQAVLPRGAGDAASTLFGDFESWDAALWPALAAGEGREESAARLASLKVEVRHDTRKEALKPTDLQRATVIANRELVDLSKPGARSKHHVEIALPQGMSYRAGDYLAILPSNPPLTVRRALARFVLAPDSEIVIHGAPGVSSSLPVDRPVPAKTLFADYLELQQPATAGQVAAMAETIRCPPEREAARRLAEAKVHQTEVLDKRVTLLDLLERFASADYALADFIAAMPPMRARQYSIASSPLVDPARCALTISVLSANAFGGDHLYQGVASTFLSGLSAGDTFAAAVRPSQSGFHLPEDPSLPIIMVAAGSGIAPFRGFIEERAALKKTGVPIGPALLFFGVRDPDMDFLYRDFLEQQQAEGVIDLRMAFSQRRVDGMAYVQDGIWRDRAEIVDLFCAGGRVFVCGDGAQMAPAVRDTFVRIYGDVMKVSRAEAESWAERIEREAIRYVADVFV